jgi:hypothetical protein
LTSHVEVTHGGKEVRYREETTTLPNGSLAHRNFVPTPDGGELEMIRATNRGRA